MMSLHHYYSFPTSYKYLRALIHINNNYPVHKLTGEPDEPGTLVRTCFHSTYAGNIMVTATRVKSCTQLSMDIVPGFYLFDIKIYAGRVVLSIYLGEYNEVLLYD